MQDRATAEALARDQRISRRTICRRRASPTSLADAIADARRRSLREELRGRLRRTQPASPRRWTTTPSSPSSSSAGGESVAEPALDLEMELSVLVARRPCGQRRGLSPRAEPPRAADPRLERPSRRACPTRVIARRPGHRARHRRGWASRAFSRWRCSCCATAALLVNELAPRPHNSYHASELGLPDEPVRAARARGVRSARSVP